MATGAEIAASAALLPGRAEVGHEVVVRNADGSVVTHVFFGLTDEELADDELMRLLVEGDDDTWLLSA
ncbi:putative amidohydrolase [Bradyrhizobium sp. USDA 4518]